MSTKYRELMEDAGRVGLTLVANGIADDMVRTLPGFDLAHIQRLTNHVGILQHATYITPNYHHGYCLDDNCRALLLALMAYERESSKESRQLIETYLAYINYMQLENGQFRNFLSFDLSFLDTGGSDDSYGRTMWALGYLLRGKHHPDLQLLGKELFVRALPHASDLRSSRAIGYTLMGLGLYLERYPEDIRVKDLIHSLANFLASEYHQNSGPEWPWFEKVISYDNALLPLGTLRAARILKDERLMEVGMESFLFLDSLLFEQDYLSTIGNETWYTEGGVRSRFGQQPIEVSSTILLYHEVYEITQQKRYLQRMLTAFQWYFGKNELQQSVYDDRSKGCRDGLDSHGVNQNQGAESTICFWMAYLDICRLIL